MYAHLGIRTDGDDTFATFYEPAKLSDSGYPHPAKVGVHTRDAYLAFSVSEARELVRALQTALLEAAADLSSDTLSA